MIEYNFCVVFRAVGAALRDDADLRRCADRSLLRGQHQRADRQGAPRHGGVHRRHGVRRLPLRRRVHRQLAAHSVRRGRRRRAAAGRARRAHVQRPNARWSPTTRAPTTSASGPPKRISVTGSNDPFGNPLSFIKLLTLPAEPDSRRRSCSRYPIPNIAESADRHRRANGDGRDVQGAQPAQPRADRAVLPQRRAANHPRGRGVLQSRRRLPRAQRARTSTSKSAS